MMTSSLLSTPAEPLNINDTKYKKKNNIYQTSNDKLSFYVVPHMSQKKRITAFHVIFK